MKKYKIGWKAVIYGESLIKAINEEEAWTKAKNGEDEEFIEIEIDIDWEAYDVTEIK